MIKNLFNFSDYFQLKSNGVNTSYIVRCMHCILLSNTEEVTTKRGWEAVGCLFCCPI